MNKLQALLIAGFLSLASVSFASSVTYTSGGTTAGVVADGASAGTITLVHGDPTLTVYSVFGDSTETVLVDNGGEELVATDIDPATSSHYYNVAVDRDSISAVFGTSNSSSTLYPIWFELMNNDMGTVIASGWSITGAEIFSGVNYILNLTGQVATGATVDVSAVPVPAAGILFASALFGAGALGRRKKKAKASVVGAFARAS